MVNCPILTSHSLFAAKRAEVANILKQLNLSAEADKLALQCTVSNSQSIDRSLNESKESNRQGRTPAPARARTQQLCIN